MREPTRREFVEWIAEQPADSTYRYGSPFRCAASTFLRDACGFPEPSCSYDGWSHAGRAPLHDLPPFWAVDGQDVDDVLQGHEADYPVELQGRTYGRLLARYAHHGVHP